MGVSYRDRCTTHRPASQDEPENRGEEAWTIGRLLDWTTDYLKRRGRRARAWTPRSCWPTCSSGSGSQLYTHFNDEVGEPRAKGFRELVRQRARPVRPWLISWAARSFSRWPSRFLPDVLIPRPESEFVVTEYLALTRQLESPRCVDVGTGSGCLAIASAHRQPRARFVAIDICERALAVARRNAARAWRRGPDRFSLGDRLGARGGEGPFDAIISNPPYIATEADRTARGRRQDL